MPIDHTTLNNLRMLQKADNPDFLSQLIQMYISTTHKHITDIKAAFNNDHLEILTRTAHSIKSSSGNLGALHLMKLCAELEENCRRNVLENNGQLIESISKEFVKVREYLETFQSTLAGEKNEF